MADSLPVMPESPVMLKKKLSIDREITKRRTIVNLSIYFHDKMRNSSEMRESYISPPRP